MDHTDKIKKSAAENSEARLTELAAQRQAEYKRSPKAILERLRKFKGELDAQLRSTFESVQTVIKSVDEKGNIKTEVMHGVYGGLRSKDSVVRTNHRSRRERAEALTDEIRDVTATIEAFESGKSLSADFDLETYIETCRKNIPDRNVMETL